MNRYARQVARIVPSVTAAALALAVAGCSDGESAGLTDEVRRDPVAVTVARARRAPSVSPSSQAPRALIIAA